MRMTSWLSPIQCIAPVASKRRLGVVRGIDHLGKVPLKDLLDGLAVLPDACAVALTSDYDPKLQKAIVGAGLGKFVVDLRQPGEDELSALIQRRAKELGISLEPRAVQLLLDVSGDGTTLLLGELEKLATAVDPGESITAEDVRKRRLEMDFVVTPGDRSTHVLNAVSPGWTSALALADEIVGGIDLTA